MLSCPGSSPLHRLSCVCVFYSFPAAIAAAATDSLRPGKGQTGGGALLLLFLGRDGGAKLKRWALDTGGLCSKARVMPITVSLGLSRFSSDQPLWRPRRVGGVWAIWMSRLVGSVRGFEN
ncbi:hypothetical protein ASPBRDRAFT_386589 [Aspergillus brasiliensis CBS 101740]|uniref:Uncharacterized protein n=1 Tax=Aspergillus brasiliensis (strain CBS 101740 / IMI 381727 / IBT 21946) TaxID=767769 RepID=A0A1L9UW29_ASPBC|nr:hypothetical protein ASPBRDRAFT_386589 [Aspergillus brasiliensis CBS 101740]